MNPRTDGLIDLLKKTLTSVVVAHKRKCNDAFLLVKRSFPNAAWTQSNATKLTDRLTDL